MTAKTRPQEFDAWNPGLESELPREYLPLSTVFRTENVSTSVAKAYELSEYCGLPAQELVAFRADRLIAHEVLIHVTAGISVPDARDYEELGRNIRAIAATILNRYVAPHRDEILRIFEETRRQAAEIVERELTELFTAPAPAEVEAPSRWRLFGGKTQKPAAPTEPPADRERRIVASWVGRAAAADNRLEESCFEALHRVATGVMSRRGRLFGDVALLTDLALTLVMNDYGSEAIGDTIDPYFEEALKCEGYRPLPRQEHPVVMNVKGASASGKSSMRPRQKVLTAKLKLPWDEFALISPDFWRKFLLDYASLGPAYKYAGTLTGHELEIIDRKLDRRMAVRAARGETSHLLIDRFRFDSFVPELEGEGSKRLLTRFGELVYMFFMITPPEATVERAWLRGLKVGRYKAVEDLLAHNVEAYTGMPELFFTWALADQKRVHYEFLDNSVKENETPRTVAFGWNGEMTVLDIKRMIDIERFRKINIHAQTASEVYAGEDLKPEANVDFLKRCARWIPVVKFADYDTGAVYARLEHGEWAWIDEKRFRQAMDDADTAAGLLAVAEKIDGSGPGAPESRPDLAKQKMHTLGAWAEDAA